MQPAQLIAFLNAMQVGELGAMIEKLREAEAACLALDAPELAALVREAAEALERADVPTYRKRVQTVVARLGHLKKRQGQTTGASRPS